MPTFDSAHGSCPADRPPAPKSWMKTKFGSPPVETIWHHVVPYSMLRDCWNTLAKHQAESPKAKVALHIYLRLLGIPHDSGKKLLTVMAEGRLDSRGQEQIEVAVGY